MNIGYRLQVAFPTYKPQDETTVLPPEDPKFSYPNTACKPLYTTSIKMIS